MNLIVVGSWWEWPALLWVEKANQTQNERLSLESGSNIKHQVQIGVWSYRQEKDKRCGAQEYWAHVEAKY